MWDQTNVLIAQTIVFAVTAIILGWYTRETRQLRKVQQWPLVIIQDLEMNHVVLVNIGNSPALNIGIAGYRLEQADAVYQAYEKGRALRSSNVILYLAPGGSAKVRLEPYSRKLDPGFMTDTFQQEAHLLSEPHPILTFHFYFQNVVMEGFFVEQIVRSGSTKLVRSVKKWCPFGVPIFRLYHLASQNLLPIRHSPNGEIGPIHLTRRGRRLQTRPLRP